MYMVAPKSKSNSNSY